MDVLENIVPPHLAIIDHNNEETVRESSTRYWAGFDLRLKWAKTEWQVVRSGSERIIVNSSADRVSNPLFVPDCAAVMRERD